MMVVTYLEAVQGVLLLLAPWLLVGTVAAAILHVVVPRDLLRRQLHGTGGVLKAVALGVPLPLCSCGVIPAGIGLKRDGASDGSSLAFLISTPQTGVDSVLVSASFLGWPFAVFKVASAALMGFVGGMVAERVGSEVPADEEDADSAGHAAGGLRGAVEHGLDVLRSIWRWLVFGILVSAAIEVFTPESLFADLGAASGLMAFVAALVISLPLYVCATASVPIAASLVSAGMPTGAALVFLMAGPATNVATMGAIRRGLGTRVLGVYLATIVVGSVTLGVGFDFLLDGVAIGQMHDHATTGPWEVASAGILLALLGFFAWEDVRRLLAGSDVGGQDVVVMAVRGMTCDGCTNKLEKALRAEAGVESVRVDLEPGEARVRGRIDPDRLAECIRAAGFQPVH